MSTGKNMSLAIGIDAAEPSLVKQLIEQNEMPALKALLNRGQWMSVQSPAPIGSGAVWPTFITGTDPDAHGMYSEWRWQPRTMSLSRYNGRHLTPFWKTTASQGIRIGTFDIPFALPLGVSDGFEVFEWWAHDSTGAGLTGGPKEILSLVNASPSHPLSANRFVNATPNSQTDLKALSAACIEGAHLRGALARTLINETNPRLTIMVFPEIHHAGHQMWHTVDPQHRVYQGRKVKVLEPLLKDVYRAVDAQIGTLIDSTDPDAIMVFALHGMRAALGFPAFLGPLLCERNFSRIADWRSQSWRGRALSLLAETKRRTPDKIKKLYYKVTPTTATHKLARPTMLPVYDWANTRAFSLPTDQYGWVRINLAGREAEGCVPLHEYDATREQLKKLLLGLANDDGQPLVRDIVSTAQTSEHALSNPLPDLVVHWEDVAFAWPLKIRDSRVQVEPVARKSTGQHASEGFCIYAGSGNNHSNGVVEAKDLGRLITQGLGYTSNDKRPVCHQATWRHSE